MPYHDLDELKSRVKVADLITASGLTLEGKGRYLRCREHDSLVVDQRADRWSGVYFWNSRGEAGDCVEWVKNRLNITFKDAVDWLANNAGTVLPRPEGVPRLETPPVPIELPQDLHLIYHRNLWQYEGAFDWWHAQGVGDEAIQRYFLGYCPEHPTNHHSTYTIPIIENGRLVNIRHRLANPPAKGDKYRPHLPGLGSFLFNRDLLTPDQNKCVLVAGEKKAIVLSQYNYTAISSTAGCQHWPSEWTSLLRWCTRVYVCFDPGENAAAEQVAAKIGLRALVVDLKQKPDDLITHNQEGTGPMEFALALLDGHPPQASAGAAS